MKNKTDIDSRIDALLAGLPADTTADGGEVSGLAMRSLSLEELASVAGGYPYNPGDTETVSQGMSDDCKRDGILA